MKIFSLFVTGSTSQLQKKIRKVPESAKSKIRFITPAKMTFPGQKEPSLASAIPRRSCLTAVAEFPGKMAKMAAVVLNLIPGQKYAPGK